MKIKIFIFLFVILLVGCEKTQNYEVKNLTIKTENPLQKALDIANSNAEVIGLLQNRHYNVEVKNVDENEKASLPNVYRGLNGTLYKVHYKSNDFELIVVTNEKQVVNVVQLTRIKI